MVLAIEKGDFIELSELLPKSPSWDDESYTEVADKVILIAKTKAIKDIETWVEAFSMFAAVKGKKLPEAIPDLLAYQATIGKATQDYGGQSWLAYDYRFRQLAAARGLATGWGQKDMGLWNETFLEPKATKSHNDRYNAAGERPLVTRKHPPEPHSSSSGSKRPKKSEKAWRSHICFPFSYSGKCSRDKCDYLHVCYDCGEGHSQSTCPQKSTKST